MDGREVVSRNVTNRHRPRKHSGPIHLAVLSDRDLSIALTRDAEAVEDCARGVGAVEGVEVDSGNVVVQEIVALFQDRSGRRRGGSFRAGGDVRD